jgi:UDP-2,3-diacylglucosamine hydrolase
MSTLFISDLHLDASRPHITRLFLEFLETEAVQADALYILGDLFEAWIGDDACDDVGDQVAEGLARLHERGVPCFFIRGNRDFLLGDAYARKAQFTLLPDANLLDIDGSRILLMHGDTLCTDDAPYQAFRTQTRGPAWQRGFLARAIDERRAFARNARAESARYTKSVGNNITDVNTAAVDQAFRSADVSTIVHGHTHRPNLHSLDIEGAACRRIVLGDWYEQGSVLRLNGETFDLKRLDA